jgi:hypothetical protein
VHRFSRFALGDLLNAAEARYRDTYSQVMDATDLEYDYLAKSKYVCSKVTFWLRNQNLRFSHHEAVAPLEPEQQEAFLRLAGEEGWSVARLREAIREWRADQQGRQADPQPDDDTAPPAGSGESEAAQEEASDGPIAAKGSADANTITTTPAKPKREDGVPVPPHLREVLAQRPVFTELRKSIEDARRRLSELPAKCEAWKPRMSEANAALNSAFKVIGELFPDKVCGYCGGDRCPHCGHTGVMSNKEYNAVPPDIRERTTARLLAQAEG